MATDVGTVPGYSQRVRPIDETAYRIQQGSFWISAVSNTALADAAVVEFYILTNDAQPRASYLAEATGLLQTDFFEGPTVSAQGTPVPSYPRNRNKIIVPEGQIFVDPTVTDDGEKISPGILILGSSDRKAGSNSALGFPELYLKRNTAYLARVTNLSGAPLAVQTLVLWTEVEDIAT